MRPRQLIRDHLQVNHELFADALRDLSEHDLIRRPVPGANHAKWQLGHLIASDHNSLMAIGTRVPELPARFVERHSKVAAGVDDPAQFESIDRYLELMARQHAAALARLDELSDADLDQPGPESTREYMPTVASVFMMIGLHWMMHYGQITVLRRLLGKPYLM